VGVLISPFTYVCLQLFYYENAIAPNYGILTNQIIYYILFSIYIIPFTYLSDVMLHNCQELIHGWKIYDYLAYQRYRFSVREFRWMLRNPVMDESISEVRNMLYVVIVVIVVIVIVIVCLLLLLHHMLTLSHPQHPPYTHTPTPLYRYRSSSQ
jgi:hypothetical protein